MQRIRHDSLNPFASRRPGALAPADGGASEEDLETACSGLRERVAELEWQLQTERLASARATERAHALADQHRLLFEESPFGKWVFDADTFELLAINQTALAMYGYTRDEMLAMRLTDLKMPDDFGPPRSSVARGPRGHIGIVHHKRKDGTVIEVDVITQPITWYGRRACLSSLRDVTEERGLEEQLRQSQKMEAIGRLAGGVAHDFNNILAVIVTDAELALEAVGGEHPAFQDIKEIQAAAMRAAALTRQLLMFSRQQPVRTEVLDLAEVVGSLERMLRRILGEDIHFSTALAPDPHSVYGDRGHVEQVLLNLIVNARDAMPSGGRLSVEVENVRLENWEAAVAVIDAGDYVRLRVADDGIGMDAMTQTRIFEPFFTTKEVGKGTGLGLATVFGIVKQCGGGIVVRSSPGCGAAFDVFFPRATPDEAEEPEAAPCERVGGGQETILVVEDDEQVRRVVCRLLKSRAYTVLEARNAEVALEVLSRRHDAVDLIVTDLVMPDIDGRTMAAMVRERNPRAKVLYMSGYTEHEAVKASSSEPMDHLLRKPFTVEELDGAVRSAIEGRRRKSRDLAPLR